MEQILLRVTGVRAEMRGRKLVQSLLADSPPWKIEPLKRSHYPDVHRECRLESVSEEQDAVGDLSPYPWQGH